MTQRESPHVPFGSYRVHLVETASTNDVAKEQIASGAEEGTVVTADYQNAGRGRNDREWHSHAAENLLCSYIAYPSCDFAEWSGLAFLASLAIADVLKSIAGIDARLKWPNDVLVSGKKIAGILIETVMDESRPSVVIGIGMNVNQTIFEGKYRYPPTSIAVESGLPCSLDAVLEALNASLSTRYEQWLQQGNHGVIDDWKRRCELFGQKISFNDGHSLVQCIVLDVENDGGLHCRLLNGEERTFHSGEIEIVSNLGAAWQRS